jgi:hypothetical protein
MGGFASFLILLDLVVPLLESHRGLLGNLLLRGILLVDLLILENQVGLRFCFLLGHHLVHPVVPVLGVDISDHLVVLFLAAGFSMPVYCFQDFVA